MALAKRLPLPAAKVHVEDRKMLCAEIQIDLLDAVREEQKRRGLTIRQVMEWGMSMFLIQSNLPLARRLGLDRKET